MQNAISGRRLNPVFVLMTALAIIGGWTLYSQTGVLGKADAVGYAICHRIAERSFTAFGRQLPMCARCTGIYLGVVTGFLVTIASGRGRASRFANWRITGLLGLFVAVMGIDGLNSFTGLIPGVEGIYHTTNALRVTTGIFCGFTVIHLVMPSFNQSVWADGGEPLPALRSLRELAGLFVLGVLLVTIILTHNSLILLILGIISAIGVLMVFTMIMTVAVLILIRAENRFTSWRELGLPMLAGFTLSIGMIFAINVVRYTATGTWDGFVF
jgi:uncharacterized membrane protein